MLVKEVMKSLQAQRFFAFYNQLNSVTAGKPAFLSRLYAEDICFIDPVQALTGIEALQIYLEHVYEQLKTCQFILDEEIGDHENMALCWQMHLLHRQALTDDFRPKAIVVTGCSHLKWRNNKLIYQRDYFDLGSLLYEQLPVLGEVVRSIKSRAGPDP